MDPRDVAGESNQEADGGADGPGQALVEFDAACPTPRRVEPAAAKVELVAAAYVEPPRAADEVWLCVLDSNMMVTTSDSVAAVASDADPSRVSAEPCPPRLLRLAGSSSVASRSFPPRCSPESAAPAPSLIPPCQSD